MADVVIVATVVCGRCVAERRRRPGVLGEVVRRGDSLVWFGLDPRWARQARRVGLPEGERRRDARVLDEDAPDTLRTHCRHHGPGFVHATVVVGRRGTVVVDPT